MPTHAHKLSDDMEVKIDASHVEQEVNTAAGAAPLTGNGPPNFMDAYRSYTREFARETERALVRKIDSRLMPFVVIIYLFNYLDRNSITQARLYGLQEDTHVKGAMYQTAISIFSAGYIFMQLPSTLMMSKLQPHLFLVSRCRPWSHRDMGYCEWLYRGNIKCCWASHCSFLPWFGRSPLFPGAIYYLSCWYTKKELGVRMALLVCGLLLSNSFAGLISAGILSGMAGVGNLAAWRWLFILEGLATVVVGVAGYFIIPDYPGSTKWLSEEEKVVAQGRLAADAGNEDGTGEDEVTIWQGIAWALKDHRVWLFACLQMATTASISYSHFFPTLIQQIGFKNSTTVLLLTAPPYLFSFFWAIGFAFDADKRQKRSPHAIISGAVAMAATVCLIALGEQEVGAPRVKRAAAIGIANTCANVASLFANYFWLDKYEPYFRESWACLLAFQALGMACILTLRYTLKRRNRHFERLAAQVDPNDGAAMCRLTEEEQRAVANGYRYII
ncbi:MFS general substrate transporter [Apiospora kogelbergensis]|uniref:MFS general substrate transporter n=1 Tax=Apiospora kogelbergensis TaxID=1337665 RepID=UPI00313089DD